MLIVALHAAIATGAGRCECCTPAHDNGGIARRRARGRSHKLISPAAEAGPIIVVLVKWVVRQNGTVVDESATNTDHNALRYISGAVPIHYKYYVYSR